MEGWRARHCLRPRRKPLGQWLVENLPRGIELELPERRSDRKIPFLDGDSDA